jgi:hypothetical protein
LLATRTRVHKCYNVFNSRLRKTHALTAGMEARRFGNVRTRDVKESRQISLGSSGRTTVPTDFTYSMRGKVLSIRYLGAGSIHEQLERLLRKIEYWHQGSITSFRIFYQDADGLGGEVKWDGEKAEVIAPR